MPKNIRILKSCSMKIFSKCSTVNISKRNYLVICIVKNLIWTTLKVISQYFDFFLHPQIPYFQIFSYHNKPYINGNIIYSAFRWCIHLNFKKLTLMTGSRVIRLRCFLSLKRAVVFRSGYRCVYGTLKQPWSDSIAPLSKALSCLLFVTLMLWWADRWIRLRRRAVRDEMWIWQFVCSLSDIQRLCFYTNLCLCKLFLFVFYLFFFLIIIQLTKAKKGL